MNNASGINFASPVDWTKGLNRGRMAWWLALPSSTGGGYFRDLVGRCPMALTSMGNANNGFRPTARPGGFAQLVCDGTAGYCLANNAGNLKPPGKYTLSCWYKTTQSTQGELIGSYYQNTTIAGILLDFGATSGKLRLVQGNNTGLSAGTNYQVVTAASTSNDGKWHHAVALWDGVSLILYLDGVKSASAAFAIAPAYNALNSVGIGSALTPSRGLFFNGAIDDVSIWNRALSATEIYQLRVLSMQGYP